MATKSHYFTTCDGKLLTLSWGGRGNNDLSEIRGTFYNFDPATCRFCGDAESGSPVYISYNPGVNFDVLKVGKVKEISTGQNINCILLQRSERKVNQGHVYYVITTSESNFICIRKFSDKQNLSQLLLLNSEELQLFDGPNVLWIEGLTVCFTHNYPNSTNTVVCKVDLPVHVSALLEFKWASLIPDSWDSQVYILCKTQSSVKEHERMDQDISDSDSEDDCFKFYGFIIKKNGAAFSRSVEDKVSFVVEQTPTNLFPDIYADIICCMTVQHLSTPKRASLSELSAEYITQTHAQSSDMDTSYSANTFSSDAFACTTHGQLLQFQNGLVHRCIQMPFNDAVDVKVVETMGGQCYVIVASATGQLIVYDELHLKQVDLFQDVKKVLVDDFIGCGSDQVLLVYNNADGTEGMVTQFLLTDFCLHKFDSEQVNADIEVPCTDHEENLQRTAQALEARLQAGLSAVREAEYLCRKKQSLIERTCQNIENMNLGRKVPITCEPHLVHLVGPVREADHGDNTGTSSSGLTKGYQCLDTLEVRDTWQRLVHEKWVIGVDLENVSEIDCCDIWISIVPCASSNVQHMESHAKVQALSSKREKLNHHNFDGGSIPEKRLKSQMDSKKSKQCLVHGEEISVAAWAEIPQFGVNPQVSCNLILHWSESDHGNHGADPVRKSFMRICGQVTLSFQNVADIGNDKFYVRMREKDLKKLSDTEISRNILALDVVQETFPLQFKSTVSSLANLPSWIQKSGLVYVAYLESYAGDAEGPFHHIRVRVVHLERHRATVEVNAWDQNQLLLLVHTLYGHLPDDVIILPYHHGDTKRVAMETVLHHMTTEQAKIRESFMQLIKDAEKEKSQKSAVSQQVELTSEGLDEKMDISDKDPAKVRDEFQRQQKHTMGSGSGEIVVDGEKYLEAMKGILDLQMLTDHAMCSYTEK
ncbi:Fanconi anemia group B protein [Lingula anatina]|uniref:Fanconi anemia group B protein n=1 Tax=Lingula anatina TaxID=7574 RepID=A0A1S3IU75_LINAN|nr:Fanconi anemia group B protein [Lingula anatina]|eukprot:XP_013401084.1 Fanconi anemia group B protein [Lingula anatina]